MSERYEPSAYNPDDPNYKENQSFESKEGKDFSTPTDDNDESASSTSANDKLQSDLESLRGDYGQNSDSASDTQNSDSAGDAQSRYDNFRTEQLGGNYGQDGDADSGSDVGSSSVSETSSGGDGSGSGGGGGDGGYA